MGGHRAQVARPQLLTGLATGALLSLSLLSPLAGTAAASGHEPDVDVSECTSQRVCVGLEDTESTGGHGGKPVPAGDSNSKPKCHWTKVENPPPAGHPAWQGHDPKKGSLYFRSCSLQDGSQPDGFVFVPDGKPVPKVSPAELAQRAVDSMKLSGPKILSPDPDGNYLVGMPMWMHVGTSATTYGPNTATASAAGTSVTATATVSKIAWQMGDGEQVVCTGPGTAYKPSYGKQASPDCGHTYRSPSPEGGDYTVTATATWSVQWNGGGASGQLTTTRTSRVQVHVGEAQVVNE